MSELLWWQELELTEEEISELAKKDARSDES